MNTSAGLADTAPRLGHPGHSLRSNSLWSRATDALATGTPVILTYPNRSALVYPASRITTAQMADLIARSSGFVQLALPEHVCDKLLIPEAAPSARDLRHPAYGQCVSVDAADGTTTGISAHDRACTARRLCDPKTSIHDLTRPGHLVPVRARIQPLSNIQTNHLATVALSLIATHSRTPGAVYADLVSPINPLVDATPVDAAHVAHELHTVAVPLD